ncbi:MAG TPA: LacI family DNA-binding transcriptional regulator [Cyclobacteriaceae bacterium]|nr:LacI family DNA-binding transcriptional regulator [Cyclobacteriaceae bacterium]
MSAKEVTIYDIARALNLSPATVSRGLKDHPGLRQETRERIQKAARDMGYRHNAFASNLRRKRTNTVGVVIPRLNSYFMATVIAGIEKVANDAGYNLIITQSEESYNKEVSGVTTMFNSRVDGLLVSLAYNTENLEHFETLLKKEIPVVFFDRVVNHPDCTSIIIDNRLAGYEMTRHLLSQGCTRILHLSGNLSRNVYADRLAGYRQALDESAIPFNDSLIISNDLTETAGTQAANRILEMHPRPDGVFASNDTTAVAVMRTLKQAGLEVPRDIAIAGFNNDPVASLVDPGLTTVNYPGDVMGEIAARTLMKKLEGPPAETSNVIILEHNLIVRASSLRIDET